jgi:Putative adhesin
MSTAAWDRDGPLGLPSCALRVSLGGEEEPRHDPGRMPRAERLESAPHRVSPLLALFALLLLALLTVAALLVWRSLGDELSGTSVARDTVDSGPEPRVRVANAAGKVRVEGVEGLDAIEYEVTRYALGPDPAAAKRSASQVPVDLTREDSTIVLQTDGGRGTGADYALEVPAAGAVEVEAGAGDVEVSGVSGEIKVEAEAGDVTVRGTGSDVAVGSPQGDVTVDDVNTDTGQVELEVGTGDLVVRNLIVGTLEASVESGDVTISGRFSGSGRIFVESGSITANLPPEDTRELTLETNVGNVVRQTPEGGEERPQDGAEGS